MKYERMKAWRGGDVTGCIVAHGSGPRFQPDFVSDVMA